MTPDSILTPPVRQNLPASMNQFNENANLIQNWNRAPFYSTPAETVVFQKTMSLFSQKTENITPSASAGLTNVELMSCQTAIAIDNFFKQGIQQYRNDLINCITLDLATFYGRARFSNTLINAAIAGATRMIRKAPANVVIRPIAIPFLAFIGAIRGMVRKRKYTAEVKMYNQSINRRNWINTVTVLEKNRIAMALNMITQRTNTLQLELAQDGDFVNVALIDELKVLNKLYTYLNGAATLKIEGKSVTAYIKDLTDKM